MKQQLFAFWEYDKFPYFLGGTVTKFCGPKDRFVETKEYGVGNSFEPCKLVSKELGIALLKELNQLERERNTQLEKVKKEYHESLKDILAEYNVPYPL